MIITLNQSEIETALTKHINDMMNLKEGVQIRYDFKATRGEEGITVTLDLSNGHDTQVAAAPVTQAPRRTAPVRTTSAEQTKGADAPFDPDNSQQAQGQQTSEGESSESTAGAAAEQQNAENASAEAAPAPKKPSLFGNLGAAKAAQ